LVLAERLGQTGQAFRVWAEAPCCIQRGGASQRKWLVAFLLPSVVIGWGDFGGPKHPRRGPCDSPDPPKSPHPRVGLRSAFADDLEEAQRRRRGHGKSARAMQQPDAGQVAHGPLCCVALGELLGPVGDLADEIRDRQERRVPVEDVHQNDALAAEVLSFSRRYLAVACLTRLVVHRKVLLSVPRRPAVCAARAAFLLASQA